MHQATLFSRMKNGPFTISTDGSNDAGDKLFPLVMRTVNLESMLVESEIVALPVCEGSATGENIFNLMEAIFVENNISWSNCLAFGCDNASVMTGKHKGVFAFIKKKNPHIFLAGCTLHLAHLAAEKAADLLPVSASDLLVDIYYYFQKSVSCQQRFTQFQDYYHQDHEAILKHVTTRWLSIDRCLDRLLKNWIPLKGFFRVEASEVGKSVAASTKQCVQRITTSLSWPSTHLYLLFLQYTNKLFNTFLLTNQSDAPQIQNLRRSMMTLLRTILTKFVKPNVLAHRLPQDVEFNLDYNVRSFEDILTGEQVEHFIKNKGTNGLKDHRIEEFKANVVQYYRKVCSYIKDNMPFGDSVLTNIEVCDISTHSDSSQKKLRNLLELYPCIISKTSCKDEVLDQFIQFQADCAGQGKEKDRADETWASVSSDYPALSHATLSLLTMPHSSAHCERVFSCVRKNHTDFRASLSIGTVEALMVLKHRPSNCLSRSYSPAQLKHLKGSCASSLASISKKD